MKVQRLLLFILATVILIASAIPLFPSNGAQAQPVVATPESTDLQVSNSQIKYLEELDLLVFEQTVAGKAGGTVPTPAGQLDGAPVLGYVFPTTLAPTDVGFGKVKGIVALAVTSHPDFDDTPLWDENNDGNFDNDGRIYHTHWVILGEDDRVEGGLSVKKYNPEDKSVVLPPTHPGMPIYLDSPGFAVKTEQDLLQVMVPAGRVNHQTDFNYDAAAAYMEVNQSERDQPMLGVYKVYSVLSGDLSLPYSIQK
jgi:hypothetical protein